MTFTRKILEEKLAEGKIRGYNIPEKIKATNPGKLGTRKGSKTKDWIALHLKAWCGANQLELREEYRFHPERKWRFDWVILNPSNSGSLKIGVEYNGIMSQKSRHTTVTGYSGDMEKINAAQALGWKVLQYTPLNYKQLLNDLNRLI